MLTGHPMKEVHPEELFSRRGISPAPHMCLRPAPARFRPCHATFCYHAPYLCKSRPEVP